MARIRRPIEIQKRSESGDWVTEFTVRAYVNKNTKDSEAFIAGSDSIRSSLSFDIRYSKKLKEIRYDTQNHRILYDGHLYDISSYDDYQEQHINVTIIGALYGS